MNDLFYDQISLAETYCDDGAFRSGARVLRALAEKLEAFAEAQDRALFGHDEEQAA